MAGHLAGMISPAAQEREDRLGRVAVLDSHQAEVDGAGVDARGRAGLEPAHGEGQFAQARGQADGGRVAGAAARVVGEAHVDAAGQESADREYDGPGVET